jgi:hypothetical protein
VTIHVGSAPNDKTFTVHHSLVSAKCPDFERMFNGVFAEGSSGVTELPEDSVDAFELFLGWLYHGKFDCSQAGTSLDSINRNTIALYVFAHKYNIIPLADRVMESLVAYHYKNKLFIGPEGIAAAYAQTTPGSRMRIYMVDSLAYIVKDEASYGDLSSAKIARELAVSTDLCIEVLDMLRDNRPYELWDPRDNDDPCEYHHHEAGQPCPYEDDEDDEDAYPYKNARPYEEEEDECPFPDDEDEYNEDE